jgi:hypothetical protein
VTSAAAERGIVLNKEIVALEQQIYRQHGWDPLPHIDDTPAGVNFWRAKQNFDDILRLGGVTHSEFERMKDPQTNLTDGQIRKELDDLNKQI